jgi:putative nucleotidyltransferase with HDIG domain
MLVAVATFITVLFPPPREQSVGAYAYEAGMVATEDVIARVPFSVPKPPEELERERAQAMESVPPTFAFVVGAADTMNRRIDAFFDRLEAAEDQGEVQGAVRDLALVVSPSQVAALSDPETRGLLRATAKEAVSRILGRGVYDAFQSPLTTTTVTVEESDSTETSRPAEDLVSRNEFLDEAIRRLPRDTPPDVSDLLRIILVRNMEYSLVPDQETTTADRQAMAQSISQVKGNVLQGEAIVRAADQIREEDLERLRAYQNELLAQGLLEPAPLELWPLFGSWLVNLMMLALFGLVLFFFRPEVYANLRWLLLIALLVAVYFAAAAAVFRNGLAPEWLPIAFVALPVGALWDGRMALVLVFVVGVVTGALPEFGDYGTVLVVLAGGGAAALSVKAVRRRSQTWVSIAMIAVAMSLVLWGHGLAVGRDITDVAQASLVSVGSVTLSALLAMGFLWVFELFTGITTDQTLLEWADPARPLLRRLSLEAPGTYAHTLNVANLSEAGANAVGANGLLCRVGVYYHDVGKMLKPHYFVENQPDGRNPHDKLKPHTSAAIVREHVTEGERLARDAKVPEIIIRFIREHHGTQKIGFFYEKAKEEAEGELDERLFYYPGPKPQSKETAIVLMADACESATRAMQDPTPERVRDLIHSIFRSKLDAGQLDDAPLTMRELTEIEGNFAKILSGVIHRRIEYPETKHLTDAPSREEGTNEGSGESHRT